MIAALLSLMSPRTWAIAGASALLVFGGVQTLRLNHAKHDLAQARADLIDPVSKRSWQREAVDARSGLAACKSAVQAQNDAVDALKAKSDANIAKADKAASDARAVAASARTEAARIMEMKPAGATSCERAESLRVSYLESLK